MIINDIFNANLFVTHMTRIIRTGRSSGRPTTGRIFPRTSR